MAKIQPKLRQILAWVNGGLLFAFGLSLFFGFTGGKFLLVCFAVGILSAAAEPWSNRLPPILRASPGIIVLVPGLVIALGVFHPDAPIIGIEFAQGLLVTGIGTFFMFLIRPSLMVGIESDTV